MKTRTGTTGDRTTRVGSSFALAVNARLVEARPDGPKSGIGANRMQPHPVQPLKLEDIDNMSNGELVQRMDDLLIARDKEIYPPDMFTAPFPRTDPTVAEFAATITVSGMSSERARRAIYAAFEFLLQRTFIMVGMGASNRLVYDSRMFQQIGW